MTITDSKKCLMCEDGSFVDMGITSSNGLRNSGLGMNLVGGIAWRAVECNACGNVQMFRVKRTADQMRTDRWVTVPAQTTLIASAAGRAARRLWRLRARM